MNPKGKSVIVELACAKCQKVYQDEISEEKWGKDGMYQEVARVVGEGVWLCEDCRHCGPTFTELMAQNDLSPILSFRQLIIELFAKAPISDVKAREREKRLSVALDKL